MTTRCRCSDPAERSIDGWTRANAGTHYAEGQVVKVRMLMVVAVLVPLVGCAGEDDFELTGQLYAAGSVTGQRSDEGCSGYRGYRDIVKGASVTVYDAAGTIVATGSLGRGSSPDMVGCTFPFTVADVPGDSDFYQVELASRGRVTVSAEDARAGRAALSLVSS